MKKSLKICSVMLALVMAFCCMFAFAKPIYAAKVSANVVTQIKYKDYDGKSYYTEKYKYNSKGLLTQMTEYNNEGELYRKTVYTYGDNDLVKSAVVYKYGEKYGTVSYTYNSKNQLTKRVSKSDTLGNVTVKYTYNTNGLLKKSVATYKDGMFADWNGTITDTYTFNSKGVLSKKVRKCTFMPSADGTRTYKYDSNGFLTKFVYNTKEEPGTLTRKLTYKGGVLTKYQDTDVCEGEKSVDSVRNITSKSISVTKARSAIVTKQQQEIINGDYGLDLYLGYDMA